MSSNRSAAGGSGPGVGSKAPERDALSLAEAADCYQASKRTLLRALTFGELDGFKVRGIRGSEWRVTPAAMARAGYSLRARDRDDDRQETDPETRRLREQLAVERARSAALDSRLGHALMTVGRLRAQLLEAGIEPDPHWSPELAYPVEPRSPDDDMPVPSNKVR